MSTVLHLRPYTADDEEAAITVWQRSWQAAYPDIDFAARLSWWRTRWSSELVSRAAIVVADWDTTLAGFVTVDSAGYLDQLVVAPEYWGSETAAALLAEAKRVSPSHLDLHVNADNARALRFYRKHGFDISGDDVNPHSGKLVYAMRWTPKFD